MPYTDDVPMPALRLGMAPSANTLPPECNCLDADSDFDIDLADCAALQRAFVANP